MSIPGLELDVLCPAGKIDMFLLHFGHFADVMFLARTNEHYRRAAENSGALPETKSHNAQAE